MPSPPASFQRFELPLVVRPIRRELGEVGAAAWSENRLNQMLAEEFEPIVGAMAPAAVDAQVQDRMRRLEETMLAPEWLYRRGIRTAGRTVKVKSGLEWVQRSHKAPGGLMRAEFRVDEGRLRDLSISGDFFCFPRDFVKRLEAELEGRSLQDVRPAIEALYAGDSIDTPGVRLDD